MPVLEKIVIADFRNIELQEVEFSPNINCISGNNGEGKTNLLDAIYYLSMTKSAFASSDRYTFRHGTEEFSLAGTYRMENGLSSRFALKMTSKGEKKVRRDAFVTITEDDDDEYVEEEEFEIRVKTFPFKPMTAEEAILQMNLLGHSFYAFISADSGDTCVVYKRKEGSYGLIVPE